MENQIEGGSYSSDSQPNPCPICLGSITEESHLDQCFHKFCYKCILDWTKFAASKYSASVECPLCKTHNSSIIHARHGASFRRHYVNRKDARVGYFFTRAHKTRLQIYNLREQIGPLEADHLYVRRFWEQRAYLRENRWVRLWMRREIQALTQEEDVEIIVRQILRVMESFRRNELQGSESTTYDPEAKKQEFKVLVSEAAGEFLGERTGRFVDELEMFLAIGLNLDGYDRYYWRYC